MNRPSTTRAPHRRGATPAPSRVPFVVYGLIALVIVGALIAALIAGAGAGAGAGSSSGDDRGTAGRSDTDQTDAGSALPELVDGATDPAIGQALPRLTGTDADGDPMTITANGHPTMIVFLAHWCPHCQREVPVIQSWIDAGGLPDGVQLVSVATAIDPRRPNYPPQDWLEREGWTTPVLYDDADSTAAQLAGLSAYPFFVAVDAQGNVVARTSGELSTDRLDAIADQLAALA